ncbi:MAG: hypothetical protein ACI9U5_000466 [Colwellia sp.]|jgi:hypothetical protein
MRILDLYIGRFTYSSASTTFTTLAVSVSAYLSGSIKFITDVKGN